MPPVCEFDNCIEDGNMTDGMGMVFLNMAIMSAVIIFCVCICFCCYFLFNEDEILETPPKIVINHSNYTSHTNNQRYRRSTSRAPSRAHSRAPSRAFSRAPSRCTSIANECFSINPW